MLETPLQYRSSYRDYFRKYLFFSSRSTFFWIFPGDLIFSPNRYQFSRSYIYVFTEQIPIVYRFSRSTSIATKQITIFQEAFFEFQRTDRQFPGRYPLLRTDISAIGLCGCFRQYIEIVFQSIILHKHCIINCRNKVLLKFLFAIHLQYLSTVFRLAATTVKMSQNIF